MPTDLRKIIALSASASALFMLASSALAQPPVSPEELEILREGVRLHDSGDYDAAIARYRDALAIDPDSGPTLHQIGYAQQAKGDLEACLETASGALEKAEHARNQLFVLAGSCASDLGRLEQAAALFARGVEEFPDFSQLHYNYAVVELRREDLAKAQKLLESALSLRIAHPSSHHLLALIYAEQELYEAALVAALRFLSFEPQGQRALETLGMLESVLRRLDGAVSAPKTETATDAETPQQTTLGEVRVAAPETEEEEQTLIDVVLRGASAAAAFSPDGEIRFPDATRRARLEELVRGAGSGALAKEVPAVQSLYRSWFAGLVEEELAEGFAVFALQMVGGDELAAWPSEHPDVARRLMGYLQRP